MADPGQGAEENGADTREATSTDEKDVKGNDEATTAETKSDGEGSKAEAVEGKTVGAEKDGDDESKKSSKQKEDKQRSRSKDKDRDRDRDKDRDKDKQHRRSRSKGRDRKRRSRSRDRKRSRSRDRKRRSKSRDRKRSRSRDRRDKKRSRSRDRRRSRSRSRSRDRDRRDRRARSPDRSRVPRGLPDRSDPEADATGPAALRNKVSYNIVEVMAARKAEKEAKEKLMQESKDKTSANVDTANVMNSAAYMQLQQLMASGTGGSNSLSNKKAREIYFGNLLQGCVLGPQLQAFVNATMVACGFTTLPPGQSVSAVTIASEGTYAFVEFKTEQEATNGTLLNGVTMFGRQLRVGRPSGYAPPPGAPWAQPSIPAQQAGSEAVASAAALQAQLAAMTPGMMGGLDIAALVDPTAAVPQLLPPAEDEAATCVVRLENMITEEDLKDPNEVADIQDDVKEECAKFGAVKEIVVPQDPAVNNPKAIGKVFVEFEDIEAAKKALKALHGRAFGEAKVSATYFNRDWFIAGNYE